MEDPDRPPPKLHCDSILVPESADGLHCLRRFGLASLSLKQPTELIVRTLGTTLTVTLGLRGGAGVAGHHQVQ